MSAKTGKSEGRKRKVAETASTVHLSPCSHGRRGGVEAERTIVGHGDLVQESSGKGTGDDGAIDVGAGRVDAGVWSEDGTHQKNVVDIDAGSAAEVPQQVGRAESISVGVKVVKVAGTAASAAAADGDRRAVDDVDDNVFGVDRAVDDDGGDVGQIGVGQVKDGVVVGVERAGVKDNNSIAHADRTAGGERA